MYQPVAEGTAPLRLTLDDLGQTRPFKQPLSSLICKLGMTAETPLEVNIELKGVKHLAQSLLVPRLSPPTCLLKVLLYP